MKSREELKNLLYEIVSSCIVRGKVKLASGKISNFYINGKDVSLQSAGAQAIGELMFEEVRKRDLSAVGGLTLGADPIVGAILAVAGREGYPLKGFIVRKEAKRHGTAKLIEGLPLKAIDRVAIIEDVVTTGGSALKAVHAVRSESAAAVDLVLALVDREEGALASLTKENIQLQSIFLRSDFDIV